MLIEQNTLLAMLRQSRHPLPGKEPRVGPHRIGCYPQPAGYPVWKPASCSASRAESTRRSDSPGALTVPEVSVRRRPYIRNLTASMWNESTARINCSHCSTRNAIPTSSFWDCKQSCNCLRRSRATTLASGDTTTPCYTVFLPRCPSRIRPEF